MLDLIKKIFRPGNSEPEITWLLLSALQVKVSRTTVTNLLEEHPDYPSLLSISDVLTRFNVSNMSFKVSPDKLPEIPVPFIAPVRARNGGEAITLVRSVQGDSVVFFDTRKHAWRSVPTAGFVERWTTGIALIADGEEATGEKDYEAQLKAERKRQWTGAIRLLALPVLTIIAIAVVLASGSVGNVYPVIFTALSLLGSIAGGLLLWYEVDEHNPVVQQICSAGGKTNCSAILHSKGARIAGFSWSSIGFVYFSGGLLLQLFTGIIHQPFLFLNAWLSTLAAPYVLFSLYYQARVAKQWCVLCLFVQGILALQLLTAVLAGWHSSVAPAQLLSWQIIMPVLAAWLIPSLLLAFLLPASRLAVESKRNKKEIQRLKHNGQIFESLLLRQKQLTADTDTNGIGITLGNPQGKYKVVKVCNPYCGPCALAHALIDEMLNSNPEIQLQIIFTVTTNPDDRGAPVVRHLLAVHRQGNEAVTKKALDDWYLPEEKDYAQFAAKYPLNGELKMQDEQIAAMSDWCDRTEIRFTPTFFVNGYQLPPIYNVNDLKYFLST